MVMLRGNERGTLAEASLEGDYDVKNICSNVCSTIWTRFLRRRPQSSQ